MIELLVTLAVAIILAAIAVPSFQILLASNRQATTYNNILSAFKLARSEAITRREEVTAHLETEDGGWNLTVDTVDEEEVKSILYRGSAKNIINVSNDLKVVFDALGRRESCEPIGCHVAIGSEGIDILPAGRIGKPQEGENDDDK